MSKYISIAQANARILTLERKQRNLQDNFQAQSHGNRVRVQQYEAEIERLKTALEHKVQRTVTESNLIKTVGDPAHDEFAAGFFAGFRHGGGQIAPDPRHPEAAKLEGILDRVTNLGGRETEELANKLTEYGVRVEEN